MYCVNWESYPNCLFKFQDFHGIYSGKYMDTEEVALDLDMDMGGSYGSGHGLGLLGISSLTTNNTILCFALGAYPSIIMCPLDYLTQIHFNIYLEIYDD